MRSRGRGYLVALGVTASTMLAIGLVGSACPAAGGAPTKENAKETFAAARARLITASQLAGKWKSSPYGAGSTGGGGRSSSGSGDSVNASHCDGLSEAGVDQNPYFVEGDYFDQKGTNVELQEEIDVYPNATQATKDVEFTSTSAFRSCSLQLFSQQKRTIAAGVGKGATVGTITTESVPIADYGQRSAEIRLLIPIKYQGVEVDYYYDSVAIAVGKYEAELDESDFSTAVPPAIANNFEQAVVKRIKDG
jgi:hypothetical protein